MKDNAMKAKLCKLLAEVRTAQTYCTSDGKPVTTIVGRAIDKEVVGIVADHLLENDVIVLPRGGARALYKAVDALAWVVKELSFPTTFRDKPAVRDGGLPSFVVAFRTLDECGCKLNSNGTILVDILESFSAERINKEALKAEARLREKEA